MDEHLEQCKGNVKAENNQYLRMHCLSLVPPHGRTSYIEPLHSVHAAIQRKETNVKFAIQLLYVAVTCLHAM